MKEIVEEKEWKLGSFHFFFPSFPVIIIYPFDRPQREKRFTRKQKNRKDEEAFGKSRLYNANWDPEGNPIIRITPTLPHGKSKAIQADRQTFRLLYILLFFNLSEFYWDRNKRNWTRSAIKESLGVERGVWWQYKSNDRVPYKMMIWGNIYKGNWSKQIDITVIEVKWVDPSASLFLKNWAWFLLRRKSNGPDMNRSLFALVLKAGLLIWRVPRQRWNQLFS